MTGERCGQGQAATQFLLSPIKEYVMYSISASDKVGVAMLADRLTSRLWGGHRILVDPTIFIEEFQAMCADFSILLREDVKEIRRLSTKKICPDCQP